MPDTADRQWEPGTIEDLIADAAEIGEHFTPRSINDWVEAGLLAAPFFQKSSRHGSDPRLFSAEQRRMFTELLLARGRSPHKRIRQDRLVEAALYMWLADNTIVTDQQARRALRTYSHGMGHLTAQARTEAARALVDQIARADANAGQRRLAERLIVEAEKSAYATRLAQPADQERLYAVLLDLTHSVDLRLAGFERGLGPPVAPYALAQLFGKWMATLRMSVVLASEQVPEHELAEARAEHVREWARYQNIQRPRLYEQTRGDRMFAPPADAEDAMRESLRDFILLLAGRTGVLREAIAEAQVLDTRVRGWRRAPSASPLSPAPSAQPFRPRARRR
jgi:hypothetical protein